MRKNDRLWKGYGYCYETSEKEKNSKKNSEKNEEISYNIFIADAVVYVGASCRM